MTDRELKLRFMSLVIKILAGGFKTVEEEKALRNEIARKLKEE